MFKILLVISIVAVVSIYLNFGIRLWQGITENMEEIDDGGPIFYPEYITLELFKGDKNNEGT